MGGIGVFLFGNVFRFVFFWIVFIRLKCFGLIVRDLFFSVVRLSIVVIVFNS